MSITVKQYDRSSFRHIGRDWCGCFAVIKKNRFSDDSREDDMALLTEIRTWCRDRFGRPIEAIDSGDIITPWTVTNWGGINATIYFSTPEQTIEFKLRWT